MIPALQDIVNPPPDENPAEPVFDPGRLSILMELEEDGDTTMVKDIARQFLKDVSSLLERLDAAVNERDFPRISSSAHTIKGSSATFGLYQVEKIARELEACAKGGGQAEILPVYKSLCDAFARGKEALNAYLDAQ